MNRFRLSPRAETDLAEIHRYIAQDNPPAADRFVGELFDLFHLLGRSPEIGQARPELRPNLRSMFHGNYVVVFYPVKNGTENAAVVHGARDIDALFRNVQT